MPTIQTASQAQPPLPNLWISPFGADAIMPLYSSVPIDTPYGFMPCVACDTTVQRNQVIMSLGTRYAALQPTQVSI